VVLGHVVAVEAEPIVGLENLEPAAVELAERDRTAVEVIEDAESELVNGRTPKPRAGPKRVSS
jgi:hypothetical protein